VAENFFSHRFDYRREWMNSIDILSAKHSTVQTRVISAVAEIADSPAGILWVRDQDGNAYQWAGSWNHVAVASVEATDSAFVALFRGGTWIVELDQVPVRPDWLRDISRAWLAVPLPLQDELLGFIVLAQPRAPTTLDGETFDLLRIVARQAAIHVAEQRYAQTLSDMRRLHDFSSRFAFVIHDIKNVVSQLTLILQNAQQHRQNPEFYEDVLATVGSSVARMNKMLARLRAPREASAADGLIVPIDLIKEEIAALQRARGITIDVKHDGGMAAVAMEAETFRSVISHLCQNAIEASDGNVQLRLRHNALRLEIEIADRGAGMPAEFIRDDLFQPLRSSKGDGFGIGAYQARELVRAAGGDILVLSRPGVGTTMRVLLPCVGEESNTPSVLRREEMAR
jgi:putative PEP-CTERM system histidine kinase